MNKKGFLPLIGIVLFVLILMVIWIVLKIALKFLLIAVAIIAVLFVIKYLTKLQPSQNKSISLSDCKTKYSNENDIKKCLRGEI